MKKLSLNELDLGTENLLQREQLKSVFGGAQPNGFDCAPVYEYCDASHPSDYSDFQECMFWRGCLYDVM